MITIGSFACEQIYNARSENHVSDFDHMCTKFEFNKALNHLLSLGGTIIHQNDKTCAVKAPDGIHEFYLGYDNNSTEQILKYCDNVEDGMFFTKNAPLDVLYMIKMSHRFLRNSPHFLKTMRDIHTMRTMGATMNSELLQILSLREEETYNYGHPVLDVSKNQFFDSDGVDYIFDHDTIHEAIAIGSAPAYKKYIKDGSEVMTSEEKFMSVPEQIRLLGVYEEACVLALERSQIPFVIERTQTSDVLPSAKHSFITALIKVCTSITSGWFRTYAWEHFYEVINIYRNQGEDDYIRRFEAGRLVLKPFKNEMLS